MEGLIIRYLVNSDCYHLISQHLMVANTTGTGHYYKQRTKQFQIEMPKMQNRVTVFVCENDFNELGFVARGGVFVSLIQRKQFSRFQASRNLSIPPHITSHLMYIVYIWTGFLHRCGKFEGMTRMLLHYLLQLKTRIISQ